MNEGNAVQMSTSTSFHWCLKTCFHASVLIAFRVLEWNQKKERKGQVRSDLDSVNWTASCPENAAFYASASISRRTRRRRVCSRGRQCSTDNEWLNNKKRYKTPWSPAILSSQLLLTPVFASPYFVIPVGSSKKLIRIITLAGRAPAWRPVLLLLLLPLERPSPVLVKTKNTRGTIWRYFAYEANDQGEASK